MSHPIAGASPEVSLLTWTLPPAVVAPAVVAGALYLRGWTLAASRMPERFGAGRRAAGVAGLAVILVALCSPIDALGHQLLLAHMIQHLLLMMVAPPLLWLGAPVAPLLLGLPLPLRRSVAGALARPAVRRVTHALADPRVAWIAFVVVLWAWHAPALYDRALRSEGWHHAQHVCFLAAGLLFWRPVILAWPARLGWPRWAMIPYVALAELQNSALAAILTFSGRTLYPAYESVPHALSLSPVEDQAIAGVIMWIPGSLPFLLAVLWLVLTAIRTPRPDYVRS
ncbi:MAG TPA: cytochrome c oxidase assembly protein [Methylomirabilota bacterium]|nr:cytochrome c oxidase assembly protein [Methylomirabilota bacterium]